MDQPRSSIPPHAKFTSELDESDPADRQEMANRVFGRDHRRDADDKPIPQEATSDFAIKNGKALADRVERHLFFLRKSEGDAAARAEAERIVKLNAKYKEFLSLYLKLPQKVPRSGEDI